jgi:hypothetical protein
MSEQILRRVGDHFAVDISAEEVGRLGLREGERVTVELRPAARLSPDVLEALDSAWEEDLPAYRYLAGQ